LAITDVCPNIIVIGGNKMKKLKFRFTVMVMTLLMLFMALPVSASEISYYLLADQAQPPEISISVDDEQQYVTYDSVVITLNTPEEVERETERLLALQMEMLLEERGLMTTSSDGYVGIQPHYWPILRVTTGQPRNVSASGFAGGQLSRGYVFPQGGFLWHSTSGSGSISASVNVGFPAPFNMMSVSLNLGRTVTTSTGRGVNVPAHPTNAVKLHVTTTYQATPNVTEEYIVHRCPWGMPGGDRSEWVVVHRGNVRVPIQQVLTTQVVGSIIQ